MTDTNYQIIKPKEAAAILGKEERTLANWRSLGVGPAYIKQNNRDIGYLWPDLIKYIEKHRVEPANG